MSEQTRRNRQVGGRKAALQVKANRLREQERTEQLWGPNGSMRGSAPVEGPTSIAEILARVQARVAAR
ncbi:hypothetical protein [Sphingomonas jatrophae]|uniref:Uncharacterized protein n=1 Tax=Sphingomonas jatrophae TaxID=1166337 RepID=A0A1I6K6C3_9SPHN|nr:hypothetical protein [Sphingomonas jatrophae]SFR86746.1 hypothetical protein SAMN05192580_1372 [Sphingomonas jatrophae]